jgi:hypothetical protein
MADVATLKIEADTKQATKDVKKFGDDASNMAKQVSGAFSALKAAAAAAVAVFAGKQVLDFFNSGIEAAIAQEQAMALLGQQLKATGEFSTQALEQFASFADEMEKTTQFGDDLVISQLAVAKAMGLSNEQSKELIKAASELSAVTGDSLATSVEQLGKTYDGVTGKSPVLREALAGISKEALQAGKGIKAVQDALGGSAAAQIETYAGALKQAENAYGNFQESIGKIIIENPTLIEAIKGVTEIFSLLETAVNDNSEEISKFVTTSVQIFLFSLTKMVEGTGLAIKSFQILSNGLLVFGAASLKAAEIFLKIFGGEESKKRAADLEKLGLQFETFFKERVEGQKNFNEGFDDLAKQIEEIALKAANATEKITDAERKAQKERDKRTKAQKEAQEQREKYLKEFAAFEKKIILETSNELGKLDIKRNEDLKSLSRYEKLGIVSKEQATILKKALDEKYEKDKKAITEKGLEDEIAIYDKNIKAIKRKYGEQVEIVRAGEEKIAKILSDKITTDDQGRVIKVETVLSKEATDLLTGMAANIVSGIGQGANGAASTIAGAVGGIVSFFAGPGFGSIIREILMLFFQDPALFEQQIEGFARAIPKLLENFADNIANIVDIILEIVPELIPAIIRGFPKIIRAFVELFTEIWYKLIPGLIKIFFSEFLPELGRTFSEGFKKAIADISREVPIVFDNIKNYFKTDFPRDVKAAAESIKEGFKTGISNFIAGASRAGSNFFNGIIPAILGIRNALNEVGPKLVAFTTEAAAKVGEALTNFRDSIGAGAGEFGRIASEAFKGAADNFVVFFKEKLPEAFKDFGAQISDGVKNFVSGISDAANQFINAIKGAFGGGVSSGGDGGFIGQVANGIGLASGIQEVPRGFPNDTFAARLTTGERVVDNNTNQDLKEFLENSRNGGLGNDQMIALLSDISSKLGGSGPSTIEVTIDKKVLGRTILDLNRRNERINA